MMIRALLLLLLVASVADAQIVANPSQHDVMANSQTTAVAAAVTKTLTGVANTQWRVYGLSAYCSAGTATVTITEASTTTWSTSSGFIGTAIVGVSWATAPYTAARGATVVVTLSSCGGGNTGTLNLQADRY